MLKKNLLIILFAALLCNAPANHCSEEQQEFASNLEQQEGTPKQKAQWHQSYRCVRYRKPSRVC